MKLPDIRELLPHSGPMVLLDQVVAADADSLCAEVRLRGAPVRIGYLLGTRHYECTQPSFALGSRLRIYVKRVLQSQDGLAAFDCRIDDDTGMVASANVTVFQSADGDKPVNGSLT